MRPEIARGAALALLLLAPAAAGAQAPGYAEAPLRDHPLEVAQIAALERIGIAAQALAAVPAAGEDADGAGAGDGAKDADGPEEGGPAADLGLLRGHLAAASPDLARRLARAIGAMDEAADKGGSVAKPAREVVALAGQARGRLVPAAVATTPGFRAAVMAALLLDEGGVAEGYEDALKGEAPAYAQGYLALRRVEALWKDLAPRASPEQAKEVAATFALLDGIFPSREMPWHLSPDPDQAEAPAQQLVGLLEAVAGAELYLGRDMGAASTVVHDLTAQGCASLEAGRKALGTDELRIAAGYYRRTMHDTLGVMAPGTAASIGDGFAALDDGEAADRCAPLLEALAAGRAALAP